MTKYAGTKSLDAEVLIDFIKNSVTMDYTFNKYGRYTNSNTSAVLLPLQCSRWEYWSSLIYSTVVCAPVLVILGHAVIIVPKLVESGLITDKNYQYRYQNLLKWLNVTLDGYQEQNVDGDLKGKSLTLHIRSNLYMEYELEGEYREKVTSISLTRHWATYYKFGKYKTVKQNGWDVTFEFSDIPTSGSCTLKSTA